MDKCKKGLFVGASKLNSAVTNMAAIKVRFAWLMILAFLLQWVTFTAISASSMIEVKKAVLILSYFILLAALCRNLHLWSLRLATVGATLNFVAILANGGVMSISPESAWQACPSSPLPSYRFGDFLPWSTRMLLPADQTRLWFLSGIIPISWTHMVVGSGDVIIGIGLLVFMLEATGGRDSRRA